MPVSASEGKNRVTSRRQDGAHHITGAVSHFRDRNNLNIILITKMLGLINV